MEKKFFGKLDTGADIYEYTLSNERASLSVIDFGLAIRKFTAFGTDIVGGFDTLTDYINDDSHQGAIIGRVANRIGGASFTMDGVKYNLPKNDGENTLHGGVGFDRVRWELIGVTECSEYSKISFTYTSAHLEEGFPGELKVNVSYTLMDTSLIIDYEAIPKSKTPIALTNHAYFNLNGLGGNILTHKAEIFADSYTAVSESLIPTGERPSVYGTPFDFNTPHEVGERIGGDFIGYDHNFILSPKKDELFSEEYPIPLAARVWADRLSMSVYTDQEGLQFYIGNMLAGTPDFKGGVKRIQHGAFCLEAQSEPDCINHGIGFYDKGEVYRQTTIYKIERLG